jgi:hypothetical protein
LLPCFPTFFGQLLPYLVIKLIGGTSSWFDKYEDQGIATTGSMPAQGHGTLMCRGTPQTTNPILLNLGFLTNHQFLST